MWGLRLWVNQVGGVWGDVAPRPCVPGSWARATDQSFPAKVIVKKKK